VEQNVNFDSVLKKPFAQSIKLRFMKKKICAENINNCRFKQAIVK